MKKVSIIAPIYKSEPFLSVMIDSILSQTYQNFELILVDDGSPDNSGKICDEYATKDNRIIVIHKENGGTSEARNEGLKLVSGEYLTFIDGDDWFEPDCLEYFVSLMELNDCQMAMSDQVMMKSRPQQIKDDKIQILTNEQAICSIQYVEVPVAAWNKMYRTELVKTHNLTFAISSFGEGLYFSSQAAQYCHRVAVGHRKVYGYRMDNVNSGTTMRKVSDGKMMLKHSYDVKEHLKIRTKEIEYAADWHINRNYFNLLWYIQYSGEKAKYMEEYLYAKDRLRKTFFNVFFHSKVGVVKKLVILLTAISPRLASYLATWRRNRIFAGKKIFI